MADQEKQAGTEQYFCFMKRVLKAYHKRAVADELDITALEQLAELQRLLDEQTAEVVMVMRDQGYSWADIGKRLGMTRAAAYKRFVGRPGRVDAPNARKVGGQPASLR